MLNFTGRSVMAGLAMLCASAGAATVGDGRDGIEPGVSAFYSGLAALEMGLFERAAADLERAAESLPEEPAVRANLGVLAMRRGDDAAAREHLREAGSLAPKNAHIAFLLGLLERRAGNVEAAVESLHRAVELDPRALKPRYALAAVLEESGGDGNLRQAREIVAALVEDAPGNPALRLKHVQLLAESGDADGLASAIKRLPPMAASWPDAAREQLQALEVAADDPGRAATRATILRNVLLRTPAFRDGLAAVQVPAQLGGEAMERLVATPVPASKPAAADTALSYEPAPLEKGIAGIAVLRADGPGAVINAASEALPAGAASAFPDLDSGLDPAQSLAVDLANDGSADVVLATGSGLRLFRQDEAGGFTESDGGLAASLRERSYRGAWSGDLEMDGDLDLVLGADQGPPVVLQNDGDGSFTERSVLESVDRLRDFVWADLDGDGVPDAAALEADGDVHVFHNARAWSFQHADTGEGDYLALGAADLSWDGRMELVMLSADGRLVARDRGENTERGRWRDVPSGLAPGKAGLFAADLDNNGALDLLVSAGGASAVWLTGTDGDQRLLDQAMPWRVAAVRDLDGDGRLDLVGLDDEGRVLRLHSRGERSYGWQAIRPRALENAGDNRINTYAVGGQVEIRAGLLVQRQLIDGPVLHFGLGEQEDADVAWILWPNGTSQAVFDLEPRSTVEAIQRLKGSCPWVFAHDGAGLRFITDFLWRSPLGMRINTFDTVVQTEDWIRVPGDALAAMDGRYEIRITAELWETHFVDGVSLLAVDHPPGTAMFVDETFSRMAPRLAPILTSEPRPVRRVVDDRGRDWTDEARELDRRYVAGLELARYQGIAKPHHVEIDLEDVELGKHPVLLASGWVYPTDTSLNVAIEQGDDISPRGLRLDVPDGDGNWVTVRPDIGFPSGKTKTMVIDLEGVFRPGAPRKLRLDTNLEVYWDRLAVAERRTDVAGGVRRLETKVAELRYRGFSETSQPSRATPEVPHYDRLQGTTQRWPDLAGYHTRFGDVRELLAGPDDRYVIMNGGNELVLRFEAPPPPQGLERDFILVGHGWVKDGDYNTAFSRTVLPLPSRSRPAYDTPPTTLEADPVYQRHAADWRRYHTRYVSPSRFLSGLRVP